MGQQSGVAVSCGVGCRRSSDLVLLWLWHRPVATAPIEPLAWEPPCDTGVALENTKKKKKVGRTKFASWGGLSGLNKVHENPDYNHS